MEVLSTLLGALLVESQLFLKTIIRISRTNCEVVVTLLPAVVPRHMQALEPTGMAYHKLSQWMLMDPRR
jgi:hypothetical protein